MTFCTVAVGLGHVQDGASWYTCLQCVTLNIPVNADYSLCLEVHHSLSFPIVPQTFHLDCHRTQARRQGRQAGRLSWAQEGVGGGVGAEVGPLYFVY